MRNDRTVSRQREYQRRHRDRGCCQKCPRPAYGGGSLCFRCHVVHAFRKRGVFSEAASNKKKWNVFVNALMARHERILHDEGFAVDVTGQPEALVEAMEWDWCTYSLKRKVLEIISKFDDLAIRRRFSA